MRSFLSAASCSRSSKAPRRLFTASVFMLGYRSPRSRTW